MNKSDQIELRWVLSVIRFNFLFILACTLLGAAIAYAVISPKPRVYNATVTMLVQQNSGTGNVNLNDLRINELLADTYSGMLVRRPVLEEVISQLGLEETPNTLAERITAEPKNDLIHVTVTDPSPDSAALIANTIAEEFITNIVTLNSEQYADPISSLQERMEELSSLIEATQSKINNLSVRQIEGEANLTRLENRLSEYRSDYRALQQDYQTLQVTVTHLMDSIKVVEAAQEPEAMVQYPYTATVTLLVDQSAGTGAGDSENLTLTYAHMLTGRRVLGAVIDQLGLSVSPDELALTIEAEPIPGTKLIQLSVIGGNVSQVTLLADTIAEVFISQIQAQLTESYADRFLTGLQVQITELSTLIEQTQSEIETLPTGQVQLETELVQLNTILAEYRSDYRVVQQEYEQLHKTAIVVIIEPAQVPVKMVSSRMQMYVLLAAVVGMMLGIGGVFLAEYLDDTIRTPSDITQALGLETLGAIGRLKRWEPEIVMIAQPHSPVAEAFRLLRANISSLSKEKPLLTLLVTSPGLNEGKSITVANLAVAMAQAELNAVAVEADLHRPRLYRLFGIQPRIDMWSTVHLRGNPGGQLHLAHVGQLSTDTNQDLQSSSAGLIGTNRMQKLLVKLSLEADVLLLDTPPVLSVADAIELAQIVDGVLLVVRSGQTRRQAAQNALESLRQAGANTLGVVLIDAPETRDSEYYAIKANGKQNGRRKLRLPKFEMPKATFLRLIERVRQRLPKRNL